MFIVYILFSSTAQRYYIGQTEDLLDRLKRHNKKRVRATAPYVPWKLLYFESFETRAEAIKRETEIKKYKSGIPFKKLIGKWPKGH